jgi:tetratricopeptide (TPR) repeat protein
VVIFFEDAHWMDAASKDLLRFLHPRIDRLPVLLMQAGRGDEAEARAWVETSLSGEGRPDFGNTIWLGALEEAGSAALVAHLLVEDLAQVIHEQSNGNPLFVSEITRWFKRTRNLNAEELRGVLQTSNILQKLVLSSLETLPEMQREIAKVAAVVGYEFRTGEVQALLEASVDAVTLSNHLRGLAKEQVIILAEAGADARYAFHQTLVRDILYNSLSFEQRRAYHAKIAAYLSEAPSRRRRIQARIAAALEAGPANPAYEAERTAEHFELAQNWQEAAVHCLMAGDQLRLFQMYEQAAVDYGRAVADLKRLSPQAADGQAAGLKFEAYLGQGELALRLGEYLTALSAFEAAQANLAEGAEAGVKKDLWLNLALVLPTQNRADEALKWLRKVLKMPGVAEDAVIVGTMAWLLWRSEKAEASKWVRKGKALLASAADEWAVGVRTMLVDFGGDWKAAEAAYLALGKATGAALSAVRRGERQMAAGDDRSALTCFQQATELWGGGDNLSSGMALALYRQAEAYWQMQDLGAARQTLEKALAALPQSAALLQAGGNSVVPRAIKMVTKGKSKRWPIWQWQAYDDAFRIAMLYKP